MPGRFFKKAVYTSYPLRGFAAAMPDLIAFWCEPRHQIASSWTDHPDINAVMLAASLVPEDPEHVPIQT